DIHRHLTPQIAFDRVFAVDQFANLQYFVVRQFVNAPRLGNRELVANLVRGGAADAVNVGQADRNALLIGNIDASDTRHVHHSMRRGGREGLLLPKGRNIVIRAPESTHCSTTNFVHYPGNLTGHVVNIRHTVDLGQNALVPVIGQDRRGLGAIGLEPGLDRLRLVVGSAKELLAAANVAHPFVFRAIVDVVIGGAALDAGETPRQPVN